MRNGVTELREPGTKFFRIESLALSPARIRSVLAAIGLYKRGLRNAAEVNIRHNHIESPHLPKAFDGFTILQLSDLHIETNKAAMERVTRLLGKARYDVCVLTGDYRSGTNGPYHTTLAGMAQVRAALKGSVYGVLEITTRFVWCRDWRRGNKDAAQREPSD